jgi:cytochrome c peroxidase
MMLRPGLLACGLLLLSGCSSESDGKMSLVEQRPPPSEELQQVQAEKTSVEEQERLAREKAARAAATEAAARAEKEEALRQAAAAKAALEGKSAEVAVVERKQVEPDPVSPFPVAMQTGDGAFVPEIRPLPADPSDYAPLAGFQAMDIPADNPITPEKAALGRQLYYDSRLSGDGSLSCYSCHVVEHGLTDGLALGKGAFGKPLTRSAPTMWNVGYHWALYWDGRAPTLEKQALAAWKGANMGADPEKVVAQLNTVPGYVAQFQSVFGGPATADNVAQALASHMRTIVGGNTPWDRWQAGDASAVSDGAKRGWDVFQRAACNQCHAGVLFTDMQFHNVGIGMDKPEPDVGRFKVSNNERDTGAFKTPTLRDIARSAPYFHDGSVTTLPDAVDLMLEGGLQNPWINTDKLKKVELTTAEKADLLLFLESLDEPADSSRPALPVDG